MLKTRIAQSLMVMGSVGLMLGVSAFAETAPQPMRFAQYMAPQQPAPQATAQGMPQAATDPDSVLQPVHMGDISYITGGIGDEERNAMKEAEKDYNLRILSASRNGDFVGDTHIVISSKGKPVLDAHSGPMFFVNLPAGNYTVEATSDGQTRKQTVVLGKSKASYIHLSW